MKIAICQPYLYVYGGVEKVILKIAEKFDSKIYCLQYEPDRTFEEFQELDIENRGQELSQNSQDQDQ